MKLPGGCSAARRYHRGKWSMVKMLSLSFCVRNFLPGENPGQPFVHGTEEWQPSSGRRSGTPALGTITCISVPGASPAAEGARGQVGDPATPAQGSSWSTPCPRDSGAVCEASLATETWIRPPCRPCHPPPAGVGQRPTPRTG